MRIRILLVTLLAAGACFGQNPAPKVPETEEKFYHLELVVKELDGGKVVNSRSYEMNSSTRHRTSVRTHNRVPVPNRQGVTPAFNYMEVGTNIDCNEVKELQNELTLFLTVNITAVASEPDAVTPVIRTVQWSSPMILPFKKRAVVFSSDDPTSKRQMQLELTASPIR